MRSLKVSGEDKRGEGRLDGPVVPSGLSVLPHLLTSRSDRRVVQDVVDDSDSETSTRRNPSLDRGCSLQLTRNVPRRTDCRILSSCRAARSFALEHLMHLNKHLTQDSFLGMLKILTATGFTWCSVARCSDASSSYKHLTL